MLNKTHFAKKAIIIPSILLLLTFLFAVVFINKPVFAAECAGVDTSLIECKSSAGGGAIREVLMIVVNTLTIGIGILAVIGITIVGTQYLTAGGNEQQVIKAKKRMFEIVVGIGVYIAMWGLMQWLLPGEFVLGDVEVASVTLPQKATFIVNGSARMVPAIAPLDANDQSLTWESSNPAVATVDNKGNITAKSAGVTTITATSANGKSSSSTITIKPEPVEIDEREAYKHQSGSSGSSGSINSNTGLTKDQAQKIADYYNSGKVNICSISRYCNKNDCSAFVAWFLFNYTDIQPGTVEGYATFWVMGYNWGNNLVGIPKQSNHPGAWSVVSTTGGGSFRGSSNHVELVVGKDGDNSITVAAATGGWRGRSDGPAVVWDDVLPGGLAYNNIIDHVDFDKLNKDIFGN